MARDVFISYPHQNKVVADAACAALEAEGIRCWIAPRDIAPSANWAGAIIGAIEDCRVMVLIFSSYANSSRQIQREVQQAFDSEKPVIPFRIENVVPEPGLRYYMGPVHWLDALTRPLEEHLGKLAASVNALLKAPSGTVDRARPDRPADQDEVQRPVGEASEPKRGAESETRRDLRRLETQIRKERSAYLVLMALGVLVVGALVAGSIAWQRGAFLPTQKSAASVPVSSPTAPPQVGPVSSKLVATPAQLPPASNADDPNVKLAVTPNADDPTVKLAVTPNADDPNVKLAVTPKADDPNGKPVVVEPPRIEVSALSQERERALKPKDTFRECDMCPEMVVVPAGSFTMGSPNTEKDRDKAEGPQHKVTFAKAFAVGKFAVTFEQWDACVADGGCNGKNPDDEGWGRGRLPVINVSWDGAKAYVKWLSEKIGKRYRLLDEAEREYVTRAGTTTAFWWGKEISTSQANYDGNAYANGGEGENRQRTVLVDSFEPNPWGLYQVHGNVMEWTEDCYHDSYIRAPTDGSPWTAGDCDNGHVFRGGSWRDDPKDLRSAARGFFAQSDDHQQPRYRGHGARRGPMIVLILLQFNIEALIRGALQGNVRTRSSEDSVGFRVARTLATR